MVSCWYFHMEIEVIVSCYSSKASITVLVSLVLVVMLGDLMILTGDE